MQPEVSEYEDGQLDFWNHYDHCRNGGYPADALDFEPPHEPYEEDFPLYKRRELKLAL